MSETNQLEDEIRAGLVEQHDGLLHLSMLGRKERRRRGVRVSKRQLDRMLFATGMAIVRSGEPEKPAYGTAADFLAANPE